ncbi:MAG: ATP citrate lyase citrate-binding domain-containing protein [Pseudomonadota bacterium]
MAQKGIREYDAKRMLARNLEKYFGGTYGYQGQIVLTDQGTDWDALAAQNPWLLNTPLVAKPDQLFGKRGKHGLLYVNKSYAEVKEWIQGRMEKEVTVGKTTGTLTHFIIEPFVPHDNEYYVAIKSTVTGDTIFFSTQGGIDIESVWDTVVEIPVAVDEDVEDIDIGARLPVSLGDANKALVANYIKGLFKFYVDFHFAYLEINPFAVSGDQVIPLDLVAKLDDTAQFECVVQWGDLSFPAPFGLQMSPEEAYIRDLDEKTGASLKLTVLNKDARIWSLVAGGGASVIFADTIADLGAAGDLANYGEYSGDPSKEFTYEYTKTVLDLMTRTKHPDGKVLLIGGGIANFTDIAKTFAGIIQALTEYAVRLADHGVKIYVRRAGPNYQEGLRLMRELGERTALPIEVYGPETHMTKIVSMALGK